MEQPRIHLPDPERVALAVDAMCFGAPWPVLVHTADEPTTDVMTRPFALFCTPLTDLETLAATIEVLERVTVPEDWRLAGLAAPTSIHLPDRPDHRLDARLIHVVADTGASASRLSVPDALELSGPMPPREPADRLDRCLRRLVGFDKPVHR